MKKPKKKTSPKPKKAKQTIQTPEEIEGEIKIHYLIKSKLKPGRIYDLEYGASGPDADESKFIADYVKAGYEVEVKTERVIKK